MDKVEVQGSTETPFKWKCALEETRGDLIQESRGRGFGAKYYVENEERSIPHRVYADNIVVFEDCKKSMNVTMQDLTDAVYERRIKWIVREKKNDFVIQTEEQRKRFRNTTTASKRVERLNILGTGFDPKCQTEVSMRERKACYKKHAMPTRTCGRDSQAGKRA